MKKKLVFIGNSIVAGYPWSKGKSFPSVVRRALKGDSEEIPRPAFAENLGFEIINKGVNGDTTAGILGRFREDVLDHSPDLAFIMTGTNDFIYRDATPREAMANLMQMARMLDDSGGRAVLLTPIPVDAGKAQLMWMAGCGISYPAVNRDIAELSELIAESGVSYLDLGGAFAGYASAFDDPDLVYLDGIHPMPEGHVFMAETIIDYLKKEFEK
ncbi:MAG: SGNH/GDSL hydrolase family protein [Lentihominibacter sp.]